ncbi:Probable sterol desaturase [gamma proteobacterium HdN1]|nr:Probable sterol desaturase [gamma proteobacterium HdN1]
MSWQFFLILGLILAFDAILIKTLSWAAETSNLKKYRIRTPETYRIPKERKKINTTLNGLLSLSFFGAVFYHFGDLIIGNHSVGGVTIFGEVLATLLLYDFMYYFLHRAMHHPKAMKYVHGVHHFVRFPTSNESIYLHPVENLAGLSLLCIAMAIIGPISAASFLLVFLLHSSINIIVHSNLALPHPIFKLFNFWALKHDLHHGKTLNRNYASIFPFWDQMFGTAA